MNGLTIAILLISAVLIFVLPRRYVLIPLLFPIILVGMSQRIIVAGLDLTTIRFLLLAGWLRVFIRSEYRLKLNTIDKVLIVYVMWSILSYFILRLTTEALIYKLGFASYSLGTYFLVRFYIQDLTDIELIIKALLYLAIPIAVFVAIERVTQHNYLSIFGNVDSYTYIREGKVRCFGSFSHAITLGSYGAFLTPLAFYMLWKKDGDKKLGIIGLAASVIFVVASSSSGPAISLMASIGALSMWLLRKYTRHILCGAFLCVIALEIVMKAHVWALINRVRIFDGSSGYHRFLIVDQLIANFNEWWLIGTKSTEHWSEHVQLADISNNYAFISVDGGLLALILFITIIVLCFRQIGKMRALASANLEHQKFFWIWGVGMFSYVVSFMGVSLWDQTIVIWYFILGATASLSYEMNAGKAETSPVFQNAYNNNSE